MKTQQTIAATMLVATTILSGCASPNYQPAASQPYPTPPTTQPYYSNTGVIDAIQVVQASPSSGGIGLGSVVGGVVGGVLGSQVGGGTGKTAATVAGALGGAVVGNQIQQSNQARPPDTYQIRVRLDNGDYQTVTQDSIADLRVGNRVRVENGRVYRY